jgi:CheY-like chemotaxis protein
VRILVADDLGDTREMMRLLLERRGHEVIEAANGQEAVERARRERPDFVLMDLDMPVMDGFHATRCLRIADETAQIPIVALSAHTANDHWRARASNAVLTSTMQSRSTSTISTPSCGCPKLPGRTRELAVPHISEARRRSSVGAASLLERFSNRARRDCLRSSLAARARRHLCVPQHLWRERCATHRDHFHLDRGGWRVCRRAMQSRRGATRRCWRVWTGTVVR